MAFESLPDLARQPLFSSFLASLSAPRYGTGDGEKLRRDPPSKDRC